MTGWPSNEYANTYHADSARLRRLIVLQRRGVVGREIDVAAVLRLDLVAAHGQRAYRNLCLADDIERNRAADLGCAVEECNRSRGNATGAGNYRDHEGHRFAEVGWILRRTERHGGGGLIYGLRQHR